MVPVNSAINIGCKIAEYFGLIEGVSTKVTKLVHQALISAKDNLEYARSSSGPNQIDYIKRAKDRFIDAVAVEENENNVLALVGLSMCQYFLGDSSGAQITYERINEITLSNAEITKYMMAQTASWCSYVIPWSKLVALYTTGKVNPSLKARLEEFEQVKQRAQSTNRKLLLSYR